MISLLMKLKNTGKLDISLLKKQQSSKPLLHEPNGRSNRIHLRLQGCIRSTPKTTTSAGYATFPPSLELHA